MEKGRRLDPTPTEYPRQGTRDWKVCSELHELPGCLGAKYGKRDMDGMHEAPHEGTNEMMSLAEAKTYEGAQVSLTWTNRKGEEILETVDVYEVTFVPMYGPCLVTNCGNIALERVMSCEPCVRVQRAA